MTQISTQAFAKVSTVWRKNNTNLNDSICTDYTEKQASPLSLDPLQEAVSGFVTFYSVSLRRQCVLFFWRTKARSYSVSSDNLLLSHLDCMHHGGLCHKSSATRPSCAGIPLVCRPDLSSLGTDCYAITNKYQLLCFLSSYVLYLDCYVQHNAKEYSLYLKTYLATHLCLMFILIRQKCL